MTTTLEAPKQKGAKSKGGSKSGLLAPPHPQVNLLPPEVHAKRGLVRIKRWLGISVVFALIVSAGMVALAWMSERSAEAELAVEQTETQRLMTEQQQFAEVPEVLGQLEIAKSARALGMSTEVLWPNYFGAIAAVAPPGVSIQSFAVAGATPTQLPGESFDVLRDAGVGTITFTAESLTVPDTAAWLDGLATVPGLADAWFSSASVTELNGVIYYSVSATVQVDELAYADRFAVAEEE